MSESKRYKRSVELVMEQLADEASVVDNYPEVFEIPETIYIIIACSGLPWRSKRQWWEAMQVVAGNLELYAAAHGLHLAQDKGFNYPTHKGMEEYLPNHPWLYETNETQAN